VRTYRGLPVLVSMVCLTTRSLDRDLVILELMFEYWVCRNAEVLRST
jgi:hypothetical protein